MLAEAEFLPQNVRFMQINLKTLSSLPLFIQNICTCACRGSPPGNFITPLDFSNRSSIRNVRKKQEKLEFLFF